MGLGALGVIVEINVSETYTKEKTGTRLELKKEKKGNEYKKPKRCVKNVEAFRFDAPTTRHNKTPIGYSKILQQNETNSTKQARKKCSRRFTPTH